MSTTAECPTTLDIGSGPGDTFRWGPLLVVLAGTFMTFLDFFIVNVALPSIHDELDAGPDAVQLVVAGYGLAFAVGMITGGRLGDLYGRRRMFTIGLALFTVTSAACGLAPNSELLVAARVAQGAAGALMTPQVLAILGTIYTGVHRAKAFAAYGLAMGIAGVLGQLLGGALIQADIGGSGWRGIFLINVPVGLLALLLAARVIPESHGVRSGLDLTGTALATTFLVAIVLPLVEGQQHGWPTWTWISMGAAPVLLGIFVTHQLARRSSGRSPLVDLSLFGNRTFALGSLASLSFSLVPPAFFFVLALYLQQGRGFTPLFSGVIFAAVGVGFFAAMLSAQQLTAYLGHQILALGALARGRRLRGARSGDRGGFLARTDARPRPHRLRYRDGARAAVGHGAGPGGPGTCGFSRGGAVDRPAGRQRARCRGRRGGVLPVDGYRRRAACVHGERVGAGRAGPAHGSARSAPAGAVTVALMARNARPPGRELLDRGTPGRRGGRDYARSHD